MASVTTFGGKSIVNRALVDAFAIALILCTFCSTVNAAHHRNSSMFYLCPPKFIRLGSSCYYFSASAVSWQEAHFACKDRHSNLTAPQRWEDRNLRNYLMRPDIPQHERWIGGIYDWQAKLWKWGGEMRIMKYQSFSRMEKRTPDELKWHCIAMDPIIRYRWTPRNCLEPKHYVCQTVLRKVEKQERNRLRQQWKDEPNEISAPQINDIENDVLRKDDNEIIPFAPSDPYASFNRRPKPKVEINYRGGKNIHAYSSNNVTPDPVIPIDPKFQADRSNDIPDRKPNAFAHRPRGQRRKPLFRGYVRNRKDPDAAYRHNVNALRSGKTGLSQAEVETHLRRLERIRKREMARRKNLSRKREGQEENNESTNNSTAAPKKRKRGEKVGRKDGPQLRSLQSPRRRGRKRNNGHNLRDVTQRTITIENALSASSELHPKVIVEIHDFKS